MVVLVTVTVSEVVAFRELDGVSTNAEVNRVAGHSRTSHHDAVITAASLN